MTKDQLIKKLHKSMFGERASIEEALTYAYQIALASDCSPAVTTAVHVLANTIAAQVKRLSDIEILEKMPSLTHVFNGGTRDSGGGIRLDYLDLWDGTFLVVSDDLIALYTDEDAFSAGNMVGCIERPE